MTKFTLHTLDTAPQGAKELLNAVKEKFNFIPILFQHTAEAPVALEALLAMMDLVSTTSLTPAQQQIVSPAASVENECTNWIAAHRVLGRMERANEQSLGAVYARHDIRDPQDRALTEFTQSVVKNRGRQPKTEVAAFLAAGFTRQHIFEVILIVAYKTLTNYTNHLTDTPADQEILAMF